MAADNLNAVSVSASLANTVLTSPAIGASAQFLTGFNNGSVAMDEYISVTTSVAPPVYLTPVIASGAAWALIINPSTGADVTLYACVSSTYTPIGVLVGGACTIIPLQVATRIGASVAASTQTVGVTFVAVTANA